MNEIIISFTSLLVGILVTVLVSRYYFIQSVKKSLTPYIDFGAQLMNGIAPDVKKSLTVKYKNKKINDLSEVQYLIANTGRKSIKDVIKPLEIKIPDNGEILDASLLYIHPKDRDIELEFVNDNTVQCIFPILNKEEFFIIKLLINGSVDLHKIDFLIAVDDLPPKLKKENLPRNKVGTKVSDVDVGYQKELIIIGTILLVLGLSPIYLAYNFDTSWEGFNGLLIKPMFEKVELIHVSKVVTMIEGLIILLIGIGFFIASLFEFRQKEKYIIPNKLQRLKGSATKPK